MALIRLGGFTVIGQDDLDEQLQQIAALQRENHELTDDLFRFQGPDAVFDSADLPYEEGVDARSLVKDARVRSRQKRKFLMVTFGANWCVDCRTLHHHLQSEEVRSYTDDVFEFINVDVGKFNTNRVVAAELGVELRRGIPVAVFFDKEGKVIGTTNQGELEPARYYSSKQILKFVRDIVEKSIIAAPDSVR
jgi:thioredoxin-related protein